MRRAFNEYGLDWPRRETEVGFDRLLRRLPKAVGREEERDARVHARKTGARSGGVRRVRHRTASRRNSPHTKGFP